MKGRGREGASGGELELAGGAGGFCPLVASVPWWFLLLGYLHRLALNFSRKSKHQEEYLWY